MARLPAALASPTRRVKPGGIFVLYHIFHHISTSLSSLNLVLQQQLAALSYWRIVSCFWVFIFLCLLSVSLSLLLCLAHCSVSRGTREVFPYLLSGLWGHLCHYSYCSVIICIPHQSEFLKAAHLFFAFLLPPRAAGTEQTFNIYIEQHSWASFQPCWGVDLEMGLSQTYQWVLEDASRKSWAFCRACRCGWHHAGVKSALGSRPCSVPHQHCDLEQITQSLEP